MRYYESPLSPSPIKEIYLRNYIVNVIDTCPKNNRKSCFTLVPVEPMNTDTNTNNNRCSGRVYVLQAKNDKDCTEWVNKIIKQFTWIHVKEKEMQDKQNLQQCDTTLLLGL